MPKVKADYSEVQEREVTFVPYDGEAPKPGVYEAELSSCKDHVSSAGNEGFEWIFVITQDCPFQGWPGFTYSNLTTTNWKTKQITDALGWTDPDKKDQQQAWDSDRELELGKRITCRIQVARKTWEGEPRGEVKNILPPKDGQKSSGRTRKPAAASAGSNGDGAPGADPF